MISSTKRLRFVRRIRRTCFPKCLKDRKRRFAPNENDPRYRSSVRVDENSENSIHTGGGGH